MTLQELVRLADIRELAASGEARRIREEAGLSLGDVALQLGTTEGVVSRWETGERRPSRPLAFRYADLLDALRSREKAAVP